MYEPRLYREQMEKGRFNSIRIAEGETDLWIGVNPGFPNEKVRLELNQFIIELRSVLEEYINSFPEFLHSHNPMDILDGDPELIRKMKTAGIASGTGPMASVAGTFAMFAGKYLQQIMPCHEFIVENGGDIFMKIEEEICISPFIQENELFKNMVLKITPGENYLSVCSSSGTFGHSFSYGKADLVTVISPDASLADAWATSLANRIQDKEDVGKVAAILPENIFAVLAVKDDKMAYRGRYSFLNI
ncbi:MAG: UPF0280 family protein [Bacteroidales bacterium]|nr:UPF0280 family protein [Bacteroidales bacterium]